MWQDKCLISLAAWFNLYSELGLWLSKIYGYFLASCVLAWFFPFFGIFAFFIWSALARILELYQNLEILCICVRLTKLTFMKPKSLIFGCTNWGNAVVLGRMYQWMRSPRNWGGNTFQVAIRIAFLGGRKFEFLY